MIRFETTIRQLTFSFPVFNASDVWCTIRRELEELRQSRAGVVVTKLMKKNLMQYMGIERELMVILKRKKVKSLSKKFR